MDSQVTGAVRSPLDERDYTWEEVAMGLPSFDWNEGFDIEKKVGKILPKDQNGSGSCGGQAWATLAAVQEALVTGTFEERSAKYVYAQTAVPGGGSSGRANSEIYAKQGVSLETLCSSYENGKPPTEAFMTRIGDITDAARTNAKSALAKSYVSISPDIDSIAQAVKANGGVVIGIDGTNNGTWLSRIPTAPTSAKGLWHHWVYVGKARIINGKKYLGILNSQGKNCGEDGWQYISEEYVNHAVYDSSIGTDRDSVWEAWTTTVNMSGLPVGFKHDFLKDVAYGQTSEEVRALQKALQIDGAFPKGFDLTPGAYPKAYYGDMTAQAILKFRAKYGIDTSTDPKGRNAGPKTRAKLNEIF